MIVLKVNEGWYTQKKKHSWNQMFCWLSIAHVCISRNGAQVDIPRGYSSKKFLFRKVFIPKGYYIKQFYLKRVVIPKSFYPKELLFWNWE